MNNVCKAIWRDEAGLVISAELVLILTLAVLAMVVGLHVVAKATTTEMNDVSNAVGAIDQSYGYRGLNSPHSASPGTGFIDRRDGCDCSVIEQPTPVAKLDGGSTVPENN